jgi:hypothetical protein
MTEGNGECDENILNPAASANTFACCGVSERMGNIIESLTQKLTPSGNLNFNFNLKVEDE